MTPARGGRWAGKEGPVGASPRGPGSCTRCGASASLPPTDPRSRKARGQGRVDCLLRCKTGRGPSGRGPGANRACPAAQRCWARSDAKGANHAGFAGAHFPGGDIPASWRLYSGPLRESRARRGRRVELRGTGVTGAPGAGDPANALPRPQPRDLLAAWPSPLRSASISPLRRLTAPWVSPARLPSLTACSCGRFAGEGP